MAERIMPPPLVRCTVQTADSIIPRREVEEWETRRLNVVVEKIRKAIGREKFQSILTGNGLSFDHHISLADRREALADLKMKLGGDKMKEIYAWETYLCSWITRVVTFMGRGRRKSVGIDLKVEQGTAEYFVKWFLAAHERNDERQMLRANPDHHYIRKKGDLQDIVETTGGSPFAAHILIRFSDLKGIKIPRDETYPYAFGGRALYPDEKTEMGAAFHQFRDDLEGGWSAKLRIEFPVMMPNALVNQHTLHLACEFSNWASAAYADEVTK